MSDDYIFTTQGLVQGIASVLDIGGTFTAYATSATPEEADARAIQSDWAAVGADLRAAMEAKAGELR